MNFFKLLKNLWDRINLNFDSKTSDLEAKLTLIDTNTSDVATETTLASYGAKLDDIKTNTDDVATETTLSAQGTKLDDIKTNTDDVATETTLALMKTALDAVKAQTDLLDFSGANLKVVDANSGGGGTFGSFNALYNNQSTGVNTKEYSAGTDQRFVPTQIVVDNIGGSATAVKVSYGDASATYLVDEREKGSYTQMIFSTRMDTDRESADGTKLIAAMEVCNMYDGEKIKVDIVGDNADIRIMGQIFDL